MPFARLVAVLASVILAAGLAACGATLPQTASITSDASAAGAAYPSITSETAETVPTPFGDPGPTAVGGREVIANPTVADIRAPSPLP